MNQKHVWWRYYFWVHVWTYIYNINRNDRIYLQYILINVLYTLLLLHYINSLSVSWNKKSLFVKIYLRRIMRKQQQHVYHSYYYYYATIITTLVMLLLSDMVKQCDGWAMTFYQDFCKTPVALTPEGKMQLGISINATSFPWYSN